MPIIEILEKKMVIEFPDAMTDKEIERAIYTDVYGQPVIRQAPKPSLLEYGKEFFQKKKPTIGQPLTKADIEAFKPAEIKIYSTGSKSATLRFLEDLNWAVNTITNIPVRIAAPYIKSYLRKKADTDPEFRKKILNWNILSKAYGLHMDELANMTEDEIRQNFRDAEGYIQLQKVMHDFSKKLKNDLSKGRASKGLLGFKPQGSTRKRK